MLFILELPETIPATEISESIPVSSCTDWQAAFGFASKTRETQDDDLGRVIVLLSVKTLACRRNEDLPLSNVHVGLPDKEKY